MLVIAQEVPPSQMKGLEIAIVSAEAVRFVSGARYINQAISQPRSDVSARTLSL